ncbi:hypothetical protein V5O48_018975, partial [Marasmius crinis-equi]
MSAQSWLLKLFLISTTLAWTAQASTITLKAVNPNSNNPSTIPTVSNFVSYSEAGVNSDGSETTYVREMVISKQVLINGDTITLPTPVSAEGTFVQSSGGFWLSQEVTAAGYEILTSASTTVFSPLGTGTDTAYQSCSLGSDGKYACVQQLRHATFSYTGTASDIVVTDVGELKKDNHAVGSTVVWQVMAVFCAMM